MSSSARPGYAESKDCDKGTRCGDGCISRAFKCYSELSVEAMSIANSLVSLSGVVRNTVHEGQLYEYTDKSGRVWFAKRFASIEQSSWVNETKVYQEAQRLGLEKMLLRPKFVELGQGKVLAVWPKLQGQTLADYLDKGEQISESMRVQLAAARQFDELIKNPDRHSGNVWVMPNGSLKLIDNDQAFSYIDQVYTHASNMTLAEAETIWLL